jgi:hypothetical protein
VRARERALLDGNVVNDVKTTHVDARVGEGAEPAAVELDGGSASTSANPSISWASKVSVPISNASRAVVVIEDLLGLPPSWVVL